MARGILAGTLFGILTAMVVVVLAALVIDARRQVQAPDPASASDVAAEAGDPSGRPEQADPGDDWLPGIEQILRR